MKPEPATPSSDGAVIVWRRDVPVGWEYRTTPEQPWSVLDEQLASLSGVSNYLCEARPAAEPLVAVMLPRADIKYAVEQQFADADWSLLQEAFEKALES